MLLWTDDGDSGGGTIERCTLCIFSSTNVTWAWNLLQSCAVAVTVQM